MVKNRSFCVIFPDSIMRAFWDLLLLLAIIYQSIMLPTRISFETETTDFLFYLEVWIDISFMFDIILNFNTGFYKDGKLMMTRKMIFIDYISLWFWVDLVSSIPYTWILAWSQGISLRDIESDD